VYLIFIELSRTLYIYYIVIEIVEYNIRKSGQKLAEVGKKEWSIIGVALI